MKQGWLGLWVLACSGTPVQEEVPSPMPVSSPQEGPLLSAQAGLGCPQGMVLVEGGPIELGMRGWPYGVVETAHLAVVEAPERGCEAAILATEGASTCWVQTDEVDPVLRTRTVELEPFCIEEFPFPGQHHRYTKDGMTAWDVGRLDEMLGSGRYGPSRLCTMTEFQAAVAGRDNWRFVYGDTAQADRCPEDEPIGADPLCTNPQSGVYEYGAVHSHWVVADADFVGRACDSPPCTAAGGRPLVEGHYVVAGGTGRAQTRQAPLTPHTWHDHGEPMIEGCDASGWDDQPVVCANPWGADIGEGDSREDQEQAWAKLVSLAASSHSMTAVLEAGLGREICPNESSGRGQAPGPREF